MGGGGGDIQSEYIFFYLENGYILLIDLDKNNSVLPHNISSWTPPLANNTHTRYHEWIMSRLLWVDRLQLELTIIPYFFMAPNMLMDKRQINRDSADFFLGSVHKLSK